MADLIKIHTDTEVTITKIKSELSINGISSLVKNGFQSGAMAGFGGGSPGLCDLFVDEHHSEKAAKIIQSIISN